MRWRWCSRSEQAELSRARCACRAGWRIICAGSGSAPKWWWGCAWSARWRWWLGCSASSRPAAPICRSTPTILRERLAFMLEDAGAPVLVTQSALLDAAAAAARRAIVRLDADARRASRARPPPRRRSRSIPQNPAYVIYTSGSTGTPKGRRRDASERRNLAVRQLANLFRFSADDVWPSVPLASLSTARSGRFAARSCMAARWSSCPMRSAERRSNCWHCRAREGVTFSTRRLRFYQLMHADPSILAADAACLRHVIFGGEALDRADLRWYALHRERARV